MKLTNLLLESGDLGGQKTGGRFSSWQYYIQNNPNWKDIELNPYKPVIVTYDNNFIVSGQVIQGQTIKLLSSDIIIKDGRKYAKTDKGIISITDLRKPLAYHVMDAEIGTINEIDEFIKNKNIKKLFIESTVINNPIGCIKIPGMVKADFAIIDEREEPIYFISHKDGKTFKDFPAYSGTNSLMYAGDVIVNNPEIISFKLALAENATEEDLKQSKCYWRNIKSNKLKNYAIFGKEFGKSFSKYNVQLVGQGKPIFEEYRGGYKLSFQAHNIENVDINKLDGDYLPIIMARAGADRRFVINGKEVKGWRIMIVPAGYLKTRANTTEI